MTPRQNRLFAADARCFDVAVDHGLFGEATFLARIEDMERAIATLIPASSTTPKVDHSSGQSFLVSGSARWLAGLRRGGERVA